MNDEATISLTKRQHETLRDVLRYILVASPKCIPRGEEETVKEIVHKLR
jgi:hypothetical protein